MRVEPKEAHIRIGNTVLSEGCSMAVRIAINSFIMELDDEEIRDGLGQELASAYKARLTEVIKLIAADAR